MMIPATLLSSGLKVLVLLGITGWFNSGAFVLPAPQAPHKPSPPAVDRDRLPRDGVLVEICENGLPEKEQWPGEQPKATERYNAEAFGFFQVPHKYIDTGIRADRSSPFLLRAAAQVQLPPGKHRILLRGRGASHLFIDGKLLLTTPFPPLMNDGHHQIPTNYLDLGPDFRFAPPGNREFWTTFTSTGQSHLVILETIVGGQQAKTIRRPELGETVVALSPEGSMSFHLLAPKRIVPYTDEGWRVYAEGETTTIARMEAERRAEAFAQQAPTWSSRRELARQWLASTPEPRIPELPSGFPANNTIDHFIAVKIAAAAEEIVQSKGKVDFQQQILPIFEANCFSCHQGKKVKGGLRIDSLEGLRAGGDSGEPAVVPGRSDQGQLLVRVTTTDQGGVMPPKGDRLSPKEIQLLKQWVQEGAVWTKTSAQNLKLTGLTDDLTFLRRVTLDTVGMVPTPQEIQEFLADARPDKRARAIDRLLADPRWADHWVSYWQDVLAENPNILNPTLNNTGPFRWWLYEALLDNKPMDVFVTELVRMRGSPHLGGPAGFALASENDVPMAEKAAIVSAAFLGTQMRCARCHDAPVHKATQKDLFSLAGLLGEGPIAVPKTSTVPLDKLHGQGRKPLINVTLKPGTKVQPAWPFPEYDKDLPPSLLPAKASPRERLAALITAPQNERFAQVIANRLWKRLMGHGLVEPVDDWEKGDPTHPELLRYLGRELVRGGYDLKHLARLVFNSHAYQRAVNPDLKEPNPFYAAPARRRLTAEQIVDSLFLAAGKALDTEEVNLDVDGGRDIKNSISLGKPHRAWQFASTSNERDRPSLALPRVQAVVDVLEAFGWRPVRQSPLSDRENSPNVIQPAVLANGTVGIWLTRLSEDHGITQLALQDQTLEALVDQLFLRTLTRRPLPEEQKAILAYLREGYEQRIVNPPVRKAAAAHRQSPRYVSWSNHLTPEANEIKMRMEVMARRGEPPTARLEPQWRQRLEDVLWSLLNAPEFVFTP